LRGEKGYAGTREDFAHMALINEPSTNFKGTLTSGLHTGTGTDVTLETLAEMVEDSGERVVIDAENGADITRWVLRRITIERARHG